MSIAFEDTFFAQHAIGSPPPNVRASDTSGSAWPDRKQTASPVDRFHQAASQTPRRKLQQPATSMWQPTVQDTSQSLALPVAAPLAGGNPILRLAAISFGLIRTNIYLVAAILLILAGAWVSWSSFVTNRQAQSQIQKLSVSAGDDSGVSNGSNLDITQPSSASISAYTVAPDHPRYIRIPSLNAKARVRQLGTSGSNQLQVPTNIYDTGWYKNSALPGQSSGATLIDGHVAGYGKLGIFANLKKLQPNDVIEIERGDGAIFRYSVVMSKRFKAEETNMKGALVSVDQSKPGLNLITCDGDFDASTNSYPDRLVVYAVAIN